MRRGDLLLLTAALRHCHYVAAQYPDPSFATGVPLFAHVRWANFSTSDLAGLLRFRSVTVQVEPDAPLPCEAQAADVAARLRAVNASGGRPPPVLMYGNLFYAEPNCAYFATVANSSWLWLNTTLPNGTSTPYRPGGRYTFDLSADARAPGFWVTHVIADAGVNGGFADGGCGRSPPAWLNASHAASFAHAQAATLALATNLSASASTLFVANCPVLPAIGDAYIPGVRGEMVESWCSDFQPKSGGTAAYCRDEILEALALSAWGNVTLQARYYLNKANEYNPYFGLAAFMVAAWSTPGSFFGASRDWDWAGDWEALLAWPWANYTPGLPLGPPTMLDPSACGWARAYERANVTVTLCGKHYAARIDWAEEEGGGGGGGGGNFPSLAPPHPPAPAAGWDGPWRGSSPHSGRTRPVRVTEGGGGAGPCPPRHAAVGAPWSASGVACVGFSAAASGGS